MPGVFDDVWVSCGGQLYGQVLALTYTVHPLYICTELWLVWNENNVKYWWIKDQNILNIILYPDWFNQ